MFTILTAFGKELGLFILITLATTYIWDIPWTYMAFYLGGGLGFWAILTLSLIINRKDN